ncbi:hypothetical protein M0802_003851 [Mischocyttarus mexicanus]|nr:hypothetical protein M0802_003851 [Mischocyttarus mexicanus]
MENRYEKRQNIVVPYYPRVGTVLWVVPVLVVLVLVVLSTGGDEFVSRHRDSFDRRPNNNCPPRETVDCTVDWYDDDDDDGDDDEDDEDDEDDVDYAPALFPGVWV